MTWKNLGLHKTVFDLALYMMIIQEVKPDLIIELGSGEGGSAIWLADIARALGLETQVYSYDKKKPKARGDNVHFVEYDLNTLDETRLLPFHEKFQGRKIVVEDAHTNLYKVLNYLNRILDDGDYLIIEDSHAKQEIIQDFAKQHGQAYQTDQFYLDFFGANTTCCKNSIFKIFRGVNKELSFANSISGKN